MIIIGLIVLVALTALFVLLTAAVIELYRDVEQLRETVGMIDRPRVLDLGESYDSRPSIHGMPAELDESRRAMVVFLADMCATCSVIVREVGAGLPPDVLVYVSSTSKSRFDDWLIENGVAGNLQAVVHDERDRISQSVGIDTAPSLLMIENGRLHSARSIPSVRWFRSMLAESAAAPAHSHSARNN